MADAAKRKRTFKKFQYRGMDLETMMELTNEVSEDPDHVSCRDSLKYTDNPLAALYKYPLLL